MKRFLFTCSFSFFLAFGFPEEIKAQKDSSRVDTLVQRDSSQQKLNMDAVYNRPFLSIGKSPVAVGGYAEANIQHVTNDGIPSGFSFQARRFTLFLSSTVTRKIKFLTEIEFEDGTKEINIEFAACDFEFHPQLNFRAGIVMMPIGGFNQNHDGPRWDFVDRPLVSTTLIPATLSNAGMGLHGKFYFGKLTLGYEAYLSNGFDERIISNPSNRTSLAAGKINPLRFEESNSGTPMASGKLAIRNRKIGELGISCMTGIYNRFKTDGIKTMSPQRASVFALDFNTSLFYKKLDLVAELAQVRVDVPSTYIQDYGSLQHGAFVDLIYCLVQKPMLGWQNARINAGVRLEYVDYNLGVFRETQTRIGDEIFAFVPTLSFRPGGSTVLRLNYRYAEHKDLLNNPASNAMTFQFGFSSYF